MTKLRSSEIVGEYAAPTELETLLGLVLQRFRADGAGNLVHCNPMSGKPTVATVPPSFTVRLAAMGKGLNAPTAFNKARSFAASTFTTVAPADSKWAAWGNCFCAAAFTRFAQTKLLIAA
jgi:hypothetical protein